MAAQTHNVALCMRVTANRSVILGPRIYSYRFSGELVENAVGNLGRRMVGNVAGRGSGLKMDNYLGMGGGLLNRRF